MSSLKINDLIEHLSKTSKAETAAFLFERAKTLKIPLASERSFSKYVANIQKSFKNLRKNINKKNGQAKYDDFLLEEVTFPKPSVSYEKGKEKSENIIQLQNTVDTLKDVSMSLAEELNQSLEEEKKVKTKLKLKLTKSKGIVKVTAELKASKSKVKTLTKINRFLNNRMQGKNAELKRLRSQVCHTNKVLHSAREKLRLTNEKNNDLEAQIQLLNTTMSELDAEYKRELETLKDLREENDWFHDILHEMENNEVVLYDSDRKVYTEKLQRCVYELLENHVASKHIGPVINCVLSLVNKQGNKLPSQSTVHNMNLQRLAITHKHVNAVVSDKKDTSIYTDETSKFGNKVCGYHLRDQDGNYFTLGMRDLVTKSASDTLDTLREILHDIDHAAENGDEASRKILTNISATMSDSASTEVKFNSLLQEYRSAVIPYTVENYDQLNDEGRQSVLNLMNFFCGLHSLVHFAETCAKAVCEVEKDVYPEKSPISPGSFNKDGESGTLRLIRTASKAFARGADEKSGCHLAFVTSISDFLKENKIRSLKLVPLRGQRFNILFHNAGQVYLLHKKMSCFLSGFTLNRLTKSVAFDLKVPTYIAGCKALGLISKLVSTPLWNLLENKNINILDMNKYYLMLKNGLEDAAENVSDFMTGKVKPLGDVEIKEDIVYECLTESGEYDNECEMFVSVILAALAKYVSTKFKDFLPGGIYSDPTDEMKAKVVSVEKHNKFSERIFVYYDNLLRFKPHISTLASEAYVAFSINKTGQWLKEMSEEDSNAIVAAARKEVANIRRQFKQRQTIIKEKRKEKLLEQRRVKEAADARKVQKQEEITNSVIFYGLWQSEEQVDNMVLALPTKSEKVKALKAQLRFRKEIFQQMPADSSIYKFSKKQHGKTVQLSVEELKENVKALVTHAFTLPNIPLSENTVIVGKRVRHKFTNEDGDVWYTGRVISQVPGYPSWYNISYDGDIAIYSYKLMEDYSEKNLEIIV